MTALQIGLLNRLFDSLFLGLLLRGALLLFWAYWQPVDRFTEGLYFWAYWAKKKPFNEGLLTAFLKGFL